jgi:hypothetical protein
MITIQPTQRHEKDSNWNNANNISFFLINIYLHLHYDILWINGNKKCDNDMSNEAMFIHSQINNNIILLLSKKWSRTL